MPEPDDTLLPKEYFAKKEQSFRKALLSLSAEEHPREVLEAALGLVDMHYEKANSAKRIVALVSSGKPDQALRWMENYYGQVYPGEGEYYYREKVILYIRCIIELTLLKAPVGPLNRVDIEKIINHWDKHVPKDGSFVYWNENLSPWLVFLVAVELHKQGIDYTIFYRYTSEWDIHWIDEKGPYSPEQIEVLLHAIASIVADVDRKWAYEKLFDVLVKQGDLQRAEKIASEQQIDIHKPVMKDARVEAFALDKAYMAWKKDKNINQQQDPLREAFALFRDAIEIKLQQGKYTPDVDAPLQEAYGLIKTISDQSSRNKALKSLSMLFCRLENPAKSFAVCNSIDDIGIRVNACAQNSHSLALSGMVRESVGFIDIMLEKPPGCATAIDHNGEIAHQIGRLFNMGQYEKGMYLLTFLPGDRERGHALLETVKMFCNNPDRVQDALLLAQQMPEDTFKVKAFCRIARLFAQDGKENEAEELLKRSLAIAERFERDYEKCSAMERIALGFGLLKQFGKALEIIGKYHEVISELRISQGSDALTIQLYKNMVEVASEDKINTLIHHAENEHIQSRIRQYLAVKLAKEGKTDDAISIWIDLMEKGMDLSHTDIIRELTDQGRHEETLALMDIIVVKEKKDATWCTIAEHLAQMVETEQSLATAKKVQHHYKKTKALTALAEAYIKNDQYALALKLKPMVPQKFVDEFLARLTNFLAGYMQSGNLDKTAKDILALLAGISDKAAVKHELINTVTILAKKDNIQLAEEVGLSISGVDTRQEMWKTIGYMKAEESGGPNAFFRARQFAHEETIHYYRLGIVKYCSRLNNIIAALSILKEISNDTKSMEYLLKHATINEVFQSNPDPDMLQRLNSSLNIQWAIDIARHMPLSK